MPEIKASEEQLYLLAKELLCGLDIEVYDVEVTPTLVRVKVDRQGGIDLEHITEANKILLASKRFAIQANLNLNSLEVSSPGMEKTLRRPEHFRDVIGKEIWIKVRTGERSVRFIARVISYSDEQLEVENSQTKEILKYYYSELINAKVYINWDAVFGKQQSLKTKGVRL